MLYSGSALKLKRKHAGSITPGTPLLKEVLSEYIKEPYEIFSLEREWSPGSGASLFKISTKSRDIFLKAMNLEITIESKLEKEKCFIDIAAIRNEHDFIKVIKEKLNLENVPGIIFYTERNNFGFLATEWLTRFSDLIESLDMDEIMRIYNCIHNFAYCLFKNGIVHTDIQENNILFRNKTPVIADFGETRYLQQDLPFNDSIDYKGTNRYGHLGKMPLTKNSGIKGYTCLSRFKKVFDKYIIKKLYGFAKECIFDNSCPYNKDVLQEEDRRIYQSIQIGELKISGQRPFVDERHLAAKTIIEKFILKYGSLVYVDIGSNTGSFCFEIAKLKGISRCIGIEAYEKYVKFANALKFILNSPKTVFYNIVCGEENMQNKIPELNVQSDKRKFVSLFSVYHHIENKESCLDWLKELSPAGVMIEFATQERYYRERGSWDKEAEYIKEKLKVKYANKICTSADYKRPIVVFSDESISYNTMLWLKAVSLIALMKYFFRNLCRRLGRIKFK